MKFAWPPNIGSSEIDSYRVPLSHSNTSDLVSFGVFGVAILVHWYDFVSAVFGFYDAMPHSEAF